MIATAKVLRVHARDSGQVARAARAVVNYVQGGQPQAVDPLARYYGRGQAQGRARGSAAGLVGLRGEVSGLALERLLRGEHAVTGRPLLAATGSAGRVMRIPPADGKAPTTDPRPDDLLTLAQAATLAGVGATYLRRLVSRAGPVPTAPPLPTMETSAPAGMPADGSVSQAAPPAGQRTVQQPAEQLAGVRGPGGRWLVRRGELERWCAARTPPATVIGYDVVCAAPKSVSLLWAFGDDALRADVADALDAAVDAAIGYLERHGAFGVVQGESRHALGLAVASYLHDVSRSVEAHLHIHNIVINAVVVPTETDDPQQAGRAGWEWRALDGELFLAEVKTAGHVGAAVLRHELSARRGVVWEPARNGVAEIASFPAGLLAAFSTRHGEVVEEFAQLVAAGFEPSAATEAAAQRGSRAAKRVLADARVQALQIERLAAAGFTVEQIRGLAPARPEPGHTAVLDEETVAGLFTRLAGPFGLTEHATTFTRRDVVQHVATFAGDRLAADGIEQLADRFLADQRVVVLHDTGRTRRRHQPETLYTVESLLAAEDTVFALIRQGQVAAGAPPRLLTDPARLDTQLAALARPATTASAIEARPALSDEQIKLVLRLLASGDLVRPVVGAAGTGKTEAMRALTDLVTAAGRQVFATAHGGRQAEELAERIGIPARVVTSWLTLLDNVDDPADVWPPGSVLIVDEATQVSTRHAERLLRHATRTGTVVILLGDPAQLGSVDAGGWFTHLATHTLDLPTLTAVHRQAGAEMAPIRAALAALRVEAAPATRAALTRLADAGHVALADTADALLERAVADWYTERCHTLAAAAGDTPASGAPDRAEPDGANGADTRRAGGANQMSAPERAPAHAAPAQPVMVRLMAERQRDVDTLNTNARALLAADGTLTGPVMTAAGRQFQAGDEVITLTQAGHTLIPTGRPASAYIRTGTVGIITAVHLADTTHEQTLDVYFPSKGTVRVPWEYLTHRFDDGRDGGLGHAYAITAAKAQGATLDTARAIVPDDTTRPALYVMLSRARTDLHAYVLRRDQLSDRDDDENWLPQIADAEADGPLDRLADQLARTRTERLATDHDPDAAAIHQLRLRHSLAELAALRLATGPAHQPIGAKRDRVGAAAPNREPDAPRHAPSAAADAPDTPPSAPDEAPFAPTRAGLPHQVALRRAELAAEATLRAAALAAPPAALLARIGPRPTTGSQQAGWEDAVAALAIYQARHQPAAPAHDPGPPPGASPDDRRRDPWLRHHDQAIHLATTWASTLPEPARARFHSPRESVPRDQAIAGLHALLDHGHPADQIHTALTRQPVTDAQAAAAVLAHRVADLCTQAGLDPLLYDLPVPRTAQDEWNQATRLLETAEIGHLATRPTGGLASERRTLDEQLSTANDADAVELPPPDRALAQTRLARLDAALDRQTSHALLRAQAEPPGYLVALLGPRPTGQHTTAWDDAAQRVEDYRHRHLGLPHGTPAIPGDANPAHAALGNCPPDPRAAAAYDQACQLGPDLHPQLPL
ncbi:MobF family relaxase [Pseudofrankia saprophytica]|uniref:MobF family relaxase n=1 Tax=Pseudofrankia saprophytica TaxID=298655 RepID=UPI000234C7FF|nr:MobF family relaxase [Pseudofrankia saprophytica]